MHPRTRIRRFATTLLKAGVDVGGRVYPQRPDPIFDTEYPLVLVYFNDDDVSAVNAAQDTYDRDLTLFVDIVHDVRKNIDDILDDLAWQSLMVLLKDTQWGGCINNIKLTGETPYQQNLEGDQYRGVTRLKFKVEYDMQVHAGSVTAEFLRFGEKIDAPIGDGAVAGIDQTIRTE